jgi:hypothetical protein
VAHVLSRVNAADNGEGVVAWRKSVNEQLTFGAFAGAAGSCPPFFGFPQRIQSCPRRERHRERRARLSLCASRFGGRGTSVTWSGNEIYQSLEARENQAVRAGSLVVEIYYVARDNFQAQKEDVQVVTNLIAVLEGGEVLLDSFPVSADVASMVNERALPIIIGVAETLLASMDGRLVQLFEAGEGREHFRQVPVLRRLAVSLRQALKASLGDPDYEMLGRAAEALLLCTNIGKKGAAEKFEQASAEALQLLKDYPVEQSVLQAHLSVAAVGEIIKKLEQAVGQVGDTKAEQTVQRQTELHDLCKSTTALLETLPGDLSSVTVESDAYFQQLKDAKAPPGRANAGAVAQAQSKLEAAMGTAADSLGAEDELMKEAQVPLTSACLLASAGSPQPHVRPPIFRPASRRGARPEDQGAPGHLRHDGCVAEPRCADARPGLGTLCVRLEADNSARHTGEDVASPPGSGGSPGSPFPGERQRLPAGQ